MAKVNSLLPLTLSSSGLSGGREAGPDVYTLVPPDKSGMDDLPNERIPPGITFVIYDILGIADIDNWGWWGSGRPGREAILGITGWRKY